LQKRQEPYLRARETSLATETVMAEHDSAFLFLTILGLVTILLVFGMKYFSAGRQTRMRLVGETVYRELAEKGMAAQAASATSIAAIQADLVEVKTKLVAIEKVLREVE
jgi:hypothetical protein